MKRNPTDAIQRRALSSKSLALLSAHRCEFSTGVHTLNRQLNQMGYNELISGIINESISGSRAEKDFGAFANQNRQYPVYID